jgi:NADPH-dependent 2,4-dienoyl-CoA reductase/sulfur reductase-like enzyme
MRLVVVGGDAAGMSAATSVRRRRGDAEIVVFERGPYTSYSMCGIPHYVAGLLDEPDDLVVRMPEDFRAAGIAVHTDTEVVTIDPAAGTVTARDPDGVTRVEPYDALLHATGAHPFVPDVPGAADHAFVVHTLDEGERLRNRLEADPEVNSVVVVGAGYIGLELAEALVRRGLRTTLVDMEDQVMASLDADMAAHVQAALEGFGVEVRLGEKLVEVRHPGGPCREVLTDVGAYEADLVVIAVGARPNVSLAEAAGCTVGETGALVVDEGMRTGVDGIWAAGDCVESPHLITGRPANVQLGTHANKQGKVAGITIAGGHASFPGVVGTAVTKVCDWEIARTGASEREAHDAGLDYESVVFEGTARSGYMPDPGRVVVKMLAERGSGRMLGAQLVGTGNVGKRIDTAATWCHLGVSVQDAQLFDLAYAPPFGGVWDLLQVGARKLTVALDLDPQL